MAVGTKSSKSSSSSQRRRQLKISYVDTDVAEEKKEAKPKERRSSRRVHPDTTGGSRKAMDGDKKSSRKKNNLRLNTNIESPKSRKGFRANGDLRSPGVKATPTAQAANLQNSQVLPDFITQTDANGNAVTPRSADAIQGARRLHPTGPKPRLHVNRNGRLSENDDDSTNNDKLGLADDPCDSLLDSLRMMCCWCMEDQRKMVSGGTQDTEDTRIRLLGDIHPDDTGKPCLVLDLDETLVHSSFRAVQGADFVIPVQIEDVVHFVYVMKRPGVDEFLVEMAKYYEIVIYTASLNKYADPLLDLLDPKKTIRARLFRESCVYYEGNYVKDLSLLDRDLTKTIIIDNSPSSYMFHPENAIDCSSFIDDPRDRELDQIGAFLKGVKDCDDMRGVAPQWKDWPCIDYPGKGR